MVAGAGSHGCGCGLPRKTPGLPVAFPMGDCILFDMYEVLDVVTSDDAEEYFAHAGYF